MNIKFRAREIREENALEYEHRTNVHYLPGAHAVRNAAQAALLVEEDRRATRMSEIEAELEIESSKRHEADLRIHSLMNEYDSLRAPEVTASSVRQARCHHGNLQPCQQCAWGDRSE
jgi:hypothetical protein